MPKCIKIILSVYFGLFMTCVAASPNSFAEAKKIARAVFSEHRATLYCGCHYNALNEIDLASCNMQAAGFRKRAHHVEWEHMMPAENFGRQFTCWRERLCQKHGKPYKGRACCEKIDPTFRHAEAELYNLWPAVGLVNQARSNYRFSPLETTIGFYGCDIEIDATLRKVEPPDRAKGIVARANLFMSDKYQVQLSEAQRKLFEIWNTQFPPNAWEKNWASKIASIEGYSNPYIH